MCVFETERKLLISVRFNFIRFGLVSLFNEISTIMGNLMPKSSFWKDSSGNLLSFLFRCGTRPYERGTQ